MTDSRSIHGALTEPSAETMSGKGREGKGIGKGRRDAAPHHVVASVTRESTAPAAQATPDAMMALRADLDDLPAVMCEAAFYDEDCPREADLIVRNCADALLSLCRPCWEIAGRRGGRCYTHDARVETRDEHFTIVQVLR